MRDVGSEHTLELPVLGIRTRFESNSLTVIEQVQQALGDWQVLAERSDLLAPTHAVVRIIVHESGITDSAPVNFRYRVTADRRVVLTTAGSVAVADPLRREALAYVTPSLVAQRPAFRDGLLEAVTRAVLTMLDRQPMHAGAVVRNGAALLLAGRSGIGKSTLLYALGRAGFEILSDDLVFAQLEPVTRVWGWPGFLHLTEDARRFFPELAGCSATLQANGKHKIAIDARARGFGCAWPVAHAIGVCLLERGAGRASLLPATAAGVVHAFTTNLEPGFDTFADTIGPAATHLAEESAWHLQLGADPAQAVSLIETVYDELGAPTD